MGKLLEVVVAEGFEGIIDAAEVGLDLLTDQSVCLYFRTSLASLVSVSVAARNPCR